MPFPKLSLRAKDAVFKDLLGLKIDSSDKILKKKRI